jgi:hypothetical protein
MSTYRARLQIHVAVGVSIRRNTLAPIELKRFSGKMGQQISRTVFDGLLAKTHVQHALIQPDGRHNDVPTVTFSSATISRGWLY